MDISKKPHHMFSFPAIDYFFHWRWWVAPVVFLPLVFLLLGYTIFSFFALVPTVCAAVLGMISWTFFEYCMHRFCLHFIGSTPKLKHLHYVVHGMHHAHPTDPVRVIFPPFGSVIIGAAIALLFFALLPLLWALSGLAGFIVGYVWYEFMHYASHHIKWKSAWFMRRKRHHLLHHHSGEFKNKNFGVTTSLWDHVFNTYMV
jgi:sterol desaturase/sphingolipid hydroxylase (fatty acid hydroxylase superfamily)